MQLIPTAKTITFNKETDHKGQFIIEPLYPGYGLTVGNSLRRVLLSSMPGAAITSIKITGVDHEFSSIDYVKEDMVDILLNIKQVNLSIEGDIDPEEPLVIKINKTGQGKVTVADFKCPSQVKVVNQGLVLATLTDKAAKFEAECIVDKGMGYLPTEGRPGEKLAIGHMAVDAIYTPINYVSLETEHVRVGEMTNWDKLILTLETNGTITCQEAFDFANHILIEQFSALDQKESKSETAKKKSKKESVPAEEKDQPAGGEAVKSEEASLGQNSDLPVAEKGETEETAEESKKRGRPKKDSE